MQRTCGIRVDRVHQFRAVHVHSQLEISQFRYASCLRDLLLSPKPTSRRRLLNKAAEEKALVLAFHFPFPGLGHVVKRREAWQWWPIETTG